ncbi:MAG: type I restriction enzyme HsdR N-terminal domain-containing protein [Alistipes sp.]|nr:type I restriction enzyme HsdR N-terminal domain-containing protein [Alistipes sp.]
MEALVQLNFPSFQFKLRAQGNATGIWDEIRRTWLVLTPEEWVRQHLIRYLIHNCGAPATLISQEYPVRINALPQRADVVITQRNGQIAFLAECKAPEIPLSGEVWAQAVRYNSLLQADFVMITNGIHHAIRRYDRTSGCYTPMQEIPDLSPLFRV